MGEGGMIHRMKGKVLYDPLICVGMSHLCCAAMPLEQISDPDLRFCINYGYYIEKGRR